jgi:hypothetical protein
MIAIEQDKQSANGRWEKEESIFTEGIWSKHSSSISNPDPILILLIITIQRGQVDV